jgi:hypothetical protein
LPSSACCPTTPRTVGFSRSCATCGPADRPPATRAERMTSLWFVAYSCHRHHTRSGGEPHGRRQRPPRPRP